MFFLSVAGIPLWIFQLFSLCPYHNNIWKGLFLFFYHNDTVRVGCKLQVVVDKTFNNAVHAIANYDLIFFHWSGVFVQISIFLPIGENFLMISGLVPMILISSYSKDGFLPSSLIFWGDYDALLNALVCCCCCWTYLNVIVLIIDNERKKELAHSHKNLQVNLEKIC